VNTAYLPLIVILACLAVALAVLAVGVWRHRRRQARLASPYIAPPLLQGESVGGGPDYALTGDYHPVGYWAFYFPLAVSADGGGISHGRLLGESLLLSGRGVG
jgi:hypothetical protein